MPANEYMAAITGSEFKATNAGDGSYLSLEYTILEGEFVNRKVWDNLNLDNPNAKAVTIAQANLGAICKACAASANNPQLEQPSDSSDLHDIPIMIKLAIKGDQNVFRKWSPVAQQGAAPANASPQQSMPMNNAQTQANQAPQGYDQSVPPQGSAAPANNNAARAPWKPQG